MTMIPLTRKDFVSDQTVRWCPGCGDYAILAQMQKILPDIGVPKENIVFISGIGCSSRFPYYMNTYGIHSIHGRAPTLATGLKIANPELSVWVITGDGDGLSIGANHLLHALRRNIDINIILFNNRIYGLTKGQYSPTSLPGAKTKSSPMGSIEQSFNPISVAIGAEATFVARTIDSNVRHMASIFLRAAAHKGTSFVEIYQNCLIFNNGTWRHVTDKSVKDDNTLVLEHGKPMSFGKNKDRGLIIDGLDPKVVSLNNGYNEDDLLIHDEARPSASLAYMLSQLDNPVYPVPIGVFRSVDKPTYENEVISQVAQAQHKQGKGDLHNLFHAADTWTVTAEETTPTTAITSGQVTGGLDEEYIDTIDHDLPDMSQAQHSLTSDTLSDLMTPDPITVPQTASLEEAITRMRDKSVSSLLITDDDGKLVGIFTELDVLRRVACLITDLSAAEVRDFMTPNPSTLTENYPIANALHMMALHHYRHIPIVDEENRPVGLMSFTDVVKFIKKYF